MGISKVIVKQIVNVAKDTIKINDALATMEDKLVNEGLKVVEKSGINTTVLPFDMISLAKGEISNPDSLLTSQNICSSPPLTGSQLTEAEKSNEKYRNVISAIIDNTNKLKSALITVQQPLLTLNVTAGSLNKIVTVSSTAVKVIKALPIPVAFGAPAIAIPLNVIMILSDSLDKLGELLKMAKGIIGTIPILINSIVSMLTQTIAALNKVLSKIPAALTILSLIELKVKLGNSCPKIIGSPVIDITQGDINAVQQTVTQTLQDDLAASGNSSIDIVNVLNEEEILASLQPNSTTPLIYKGFTLVIETNPENTYSFPQRRIAATRFFSTENGSYFTRNIKKAPLNGPITIYNDILGKDGYSYSSSVQVLVEEAYYQIDLYSAGLMEMVEENMFGVGEDSAFSDNPFSSIPSSDTGSENPGSGSNAIVNGCTDPLADNYDPNATLNDGSCIYPTPYPLNHFIVSGSQTLDTPLVYTNQATAEWETRGTITTITPNVRVTFAVTTNPNNSDFIDAKFRIWQPPHTTTNVGLVGIEAYPDTSFTGVKEIVNGTNPITIISPGIYNYRMWYDGYYPTDTGQISFILGEE